MKLIKAEKATELFLWQENMKTHMKRSAAMENHKATMFLVVIGQCTDASMRAKIEAHTNYDRFAEDSPQPNM
jgi:hypothetical protein